tara:strand:+ start:168 stop:665 length:498 start_codon:yes stop_codon:yes gene_type:complete
MAKSLTLKFGADTRKLTKALGTMRKKITGSIGGAFRFSTSLRGLAMAGIGGFGASKALGAMMNLSPEFADAMLKLQEPLAELTRIIADRLAPPLLRLADFLANFMGTTAAPAVTQAATSGGNAIREGAYRGGSARLHNQGRRTLNWFMYDPVGAVMMPGMLGVYR